MPKAAQPTSSIAADRRRQILERRRAALQDRGDTNAARILALAAEKCCGRFAEYDSEPDDASLQPSLSTDDDRTERGMALSKMLMDAQQKDRASRKSSLRHHKGAADLGLTVSDASNINEVSGVHFQEYSGIDDEEECNSLLDSSSDSFFDADMSNLDLSSVQSRSTCTSASRSDAEDDHTRNRSYDSYSQTASTHPLPLSEALLSPPACETLDASIISENTSFLHGEFAASSSIGLFMDDDWDVTRIPAGITKASPNEQLSSPHTKATIQLSSVESLAHASPSKPTVNQTGVLSSRKHEGLDRVANTPASRIHPSLKIQDVSDLTELEEFGCDLGSITTHAFDEKEGISQAEQNLSHNKKEKTQELERSTAKFRCFVAILLATAFLCFLAAALLIYHHFYGPLWGSVAASVKGRGHSEASAGSIDNIFVGIDGASRTKNNPTLRPSEEPTQQQLLLDEPDITPQPYEAFSFFVTSSIPKNEEEILLFSRQVDELSSNAKEKKDVFLVHVGGIIGPSNDLFACDGSRYEAVEQALVEHCRILALVLPGGTDWIKCPYPSEAFHIWTDNFVGIEENWSNSEPLSPSSIDRQANRRENFAFVFSDVLFIGLNMVVKDAEPYELRRRMWENYDWIQLNVANAVGTRAIIIFGCDWYDKFFEVLEILLGQINLPIIYIYGGGDDFKVYHAGDGLDFWSLQLDTSNSVVAQPPLKVSILGGVEDKTPHGDQGSRIAGFIEFDEREDEARNV